ncbi:hypothetical protein Y032_1017g3402 [Ancylostoma ceylanicum]|uniref:Uncharacterized protein n=1 Tax=Ancylostoma ceylanicum TaxID=53326 RepID=A0A016W700_9BILA|nr:hypothetical protein Y032_1017g3402 [Ancylostoma ceylanicum]
MTCWIQEEEPLAEISGDELVQGEDEEAHENGTEETAEVDDEHDTKQFDGEEVDTHDSKTPEPPVSFDNEPADKVPAEAAPQPQIRNYNFESDTESLTGLTRPDFQMPTRKRTEKKERPKKQEDEHTSYRRSKKVFSPFLFLGEYYLSVCPILSISARFSETFYKDVLKALSTIVNLEEKFLGIWYF